MSAKQSNEQRVKLIFQKGYGNKTLPVNGQTGQYCPTKYTTFSSKQENTAPQWAFKLNTVLQKHPKTWQFAKC